MSRGCAAPCCAGCGGAGPPTGTASCPGSPSTSAASAGEAAAERGGAGRGGGRGLTHRRPAQTLLFLSRTLRYVPESSQDKIIPDEAVLETLLRAFAALFASDLGRQAPVLAARPEIGRKYGETEPGRCEEAARGPQEVLFQALGFGLARRHSSLPAAGTGVFLSRGGARRGAVVAMYPGNCH